VAGVSTPDLQADRCRLCHAPCGECGCRLGGCYSEEWWASQRTDPQLYQQPLQVRSCPSAYTAWQGLVLRCTGEHLQGNPRRGQVHQQRVAGMTWTWYDDEADREGAR